MTKHVLPHHSAKPLANNITRQANNSKLLLPLILTRQHTSRPQVADHHQRTPTYDAAPLRTDPRAESQPNTTRPIYPVCARPNVPPHTPEPPSPEGPTSMMPLKDLPLDPSMNDKDPAEGNPKRTPTKHPVAWMNPTNAAPNAHSKHPALQIRDPQDKNQTLSPKADTHEPARKRVPLQSPHIGRTSQCLLGNKTLDSKSWKGEERQTREHADTLRILVPQATQSSVRAAPTPRTCPKQILPILELQPPEPQTCHRIFVFLLIFSTISNFKGDRLAKCTKDK